MRENMIANKQFDLSRMIISDQGSEFKSESQEFLGTMKAKQKMQKSYPPQTYIDVVNTLATQDSDAMLSTNGKTRVFQ